MTPPIRPEIHSLVDFTDPEKMTLRDAVEWYKQLLRTDLGVPTALEVKYMDERWATLCLAISEREKVPAGWISWLLSELAQSEFNLLRTAQAEAQLAFQFGMQE